MDISSNILDAVQTASSDPLKRPATSNYIITNPHDNDNTRAHKRSTTAAAAASPHLLSRPSSSRKRSRSRPRLARSRSAHSSADDCSTTSDSDGVDGHGYHTDFTSPASSESNPDDVMPSGDVDDFRHREYPQLKGKVYLDHGGSTLYARSLIEDFSADLIANLYGNPHSASTPSAIAGHRIDAIRERTLRFFNADPAHFDLVFVANATAAIKLVIDCMNDYAASTNTPVWYGYHRDAHTSVVGVRETTKMSRCFTTDEEVDIWINSGGFGGPRARQLGLFAYPGQSNMTGRRLPLSWPGRIRKQFHKAATYTLLDAAALASTAPLDLSDPATAPDFTALSFYKIFGFPNVGALIVRKDSAHVLSSRRYFGGGTVDMIITLHDSWHAKKEGALHERLEDGTLPFHSIFALDHAINVHERLYGPNPMKTISAHTARLGKQVYDSLCALHHANGAPLVRIYKDSGAVYGDPVSQGATIAFNVLKPDGGLVGYEDVEEAADDRNIFVRSGSLCNPGGMATYLNWSPAEMRAAYVAGHRCSNPTQVMFGRATGVVRVSLGAMTTDSDVQTLITFLKDVYLDNRTGAAMARPTVAVPTSNSSSHPHRASTMAAFPSRPASPPTPISPGAQPLPSTLPSLSIISAAHAIAETHGLRLDRNPSERRPRFKPEEYTRHRKPWEEDFRKGQLASPTTTTTPVSPDAGSQPASGPLSVSNQSLLPDDASVVRSTGGFGGAGASSVKARRFGRSVVNLLRTKSHQTDHAAAAVVVEAGGPAGGAAAQTPPVRQAAIAAPPSVTASPDLVLQDVPRIGGGERALPSPTFKPPAHGQGQPGRLFRQPSNDRALRMGKSMDRLAQKGYAE